MQLLRGTRRSRVYVLIPVFVLVAASLACGGTAVMPPGPVEDQRQGPAPIEEPVQPLETLEPLPEIVEEVEQDEAAFASESIDVNDVCWTILRSAELGEVLQSESDEVDDLVADGRLIGVRFGIENLGGDPLTFVGMKVFDDQGHEYTYLPGALPFIIDEEACDVEQLEPGDALTCTAIYDVEVDAAGLQAVLSDLSLLGGEEIAVDLGLD